MGNLALTEKTLYEIWQKQEFSKSLETISGESVEILDIGALNEDSAGADFKNARIRIGNLTYVGDIEIDGSYNDWKAHGHNINNRYNSVVLHAALENKFHNPYVYTKDGRKVPSICLHEFIDSGLAEELASKLDPPKKGSKQFLKCSSLNHEYPQTDKEKYLLDLGFERLDKKCKRIYERLKELAYIREMHIKEPVINYELAGDFSEKKYDYNNFNNREIWEQLLYELIFEALGYSKNKTIMLNLAQNVNIDFLRKLGSNSELTDNLEAAFFNIAGLYKKGEEDTSEYTTRLGSLWNDIGRIYDGKTFNETHWHFFKLRPQNFPTIRIAGGVRLLKSLLYEDYIETLIKKIREIHNFNVLINIIRSLLIVKSEGYWRNHYVFGKDAGSEIKYFIGVSRADEMIINVIIPYFAVYFDIFGYEELSKKIFKLYSFYNQKSENKLVNDVAESLGLEELVKKTVYQQGMIELFRSYCSKGKCLECQIGKTVFS